MTTEYEVHADKDKPVHITIPDYPRPMNGVALSAAGLAEIVDRLARRAAKREAKVRDAMSAEIERADKIAKALDERATMHDRDGVALAKLSLAHEALKKTAAASLLMIGDLKSLLAQREQQAKDAFASFENARKEVDIHKAAQDRAEKACTARGEAATQALARVRDLERELANLRRSDAQDFKGKTRLYEVTVPLADPSHPNGTRSFQARVLAFVEGETCRVDAMCLNDVAMGKWTPTYMGALMVAERLSVYEECCKAERARVQTASAT